MVKIDAIYRPPKPFKVQAHAGTGVYFAEGSRHNMHAMFDFSTEERSTYEMAICLAASTALEGIRDLLMIRPRSTADLNCPRKCISWD